jgi:hypothetical protein
LNREAAAYWMPRMKRGMTPRGHGCSFSRHEMSEVLKRTALLNEGAGNAGCALHPRPPVQQKSTGVSNQGYTATAGIPCTMVLRLIRDLPGDRALLPPSPVRRLMRLHELSASVGAPGPHDFAVRNAARTSAHSPRPPHPASNVRDDRETPLVRRRDGIGIFLFLPGCQEKFGKSEIDRSASFRDAPLGAGPESILPVVVMDSGLASVARAPE